MANLQELKINDTPYLDIIYPVGCIFQTIESSFDPNVTFGGTWSRIKGKFLVGVNEDESEYSEAESTGGEKTHKLTANEMPSHTHSISSNGTFTIGNNQGSGVSGIPAGQSGWGSIGSADWYRFWNNTTGGDAAHNNLPHYYAVYIWKREY